MNSITDALFPGTEEILGGHFSDTLRDYRNILVVATNGPDIEGEDILKALSLPIAAFAVTEGGGKLIALHSSGRLDKVTLADEREVEKLHLLEEDVKQNPVMQAMLEDTEPRGNAAPIRTPYDTNIVLTLPTTFEMLRQRVESVTRHRLDEVFPDINSSNYVDIVLSFANEEFTAAMSRLNVADSLNVLTKKQNRRIYVLPKHSFDGDLSKSNGADVGSLTLNLNSDYEYPRWRMENSVYVADKAADVTTEGQKVIGASERNMITGGISFFDGYKPGPEMNVVELMEIWKDPPQYIAKVSCRLAINVTMDESAPKMEFVEKVPVLHIGSGLKALEALSHLFQRLHG